MEKKIKAKKIALGVFMTACLVLFYSLNSDIVGIKKTNAQTINLADVSAHNTPGDCWLIISNKVYNLTSFLSIHSGGSSTISSYCGRDATTYFLNRHPASSYVNYLVTHLYYQGDLAVVTSTPTPTPTFSPTPSPTPSPSPTSSPTPTPTPTASPSPSPSPSPTSSPTSPTSTPTSSFSPSPVSGTSSIAAKIIVTPHENTVLIDEARLFKAIAFDINHKKIPGASIIFTLSDNSIGTIDANGLFVATKAGAADIIATSGSVTAKAEIKVLVKNAIDDDDDDEWEDDDDYMFDKDSIIYKYESRDEEDDD